MELIPKPKSAFLRVKCPECEHEMIVFNHAKSNVECQGENCEHIILSPMGGKAEIHGEILEELEL